MTTITFLLYRRGELLTVRAELHDDALEEHGGGAAHVVEVLPTGETRRLVGSEAGPSGPKAWRLYPAELAAHDAVEEICRVAAALCHRPWSGQCVRRWPAWCMHGVVNYPLLDVNALRVAALWWSIGQESRHSSDHPDGPSDEKTYREEAPLPWR